MLPLPTLRDCTEAEVVRLLVVCYPEQSPSPEVLAELNQSLVRIRMPTQRLAPRNGVDEPSSPAVP
jgi:hypothetical protein